MARRQLLTTVVESIQLYGASTWADCIPAYLVDKHMGAVQRKMNLRIISGWRTLSRDAANVLSGVPSIRLLALERKEIWVEQEKYTVRKLPYIYCVYILRFQIHRLYTYIYGSFLTVYRWRQGLNKCDVRLRDRSWTARSIN